MPAGILNYKAAPVPMAGIKDPDMDDEELLAEATELSLSIQADENDEND